VEGLNVKFEDLEEQLAAEKQEKVRG